MRIRTGLPEDLDRITAVEAACFPPAEAATAEDFAGRLAHYAGHFWLLEDDDGTLLSFVDGMRRAGHPGRNVCGCFLAP